MNTTHQRISDAYSLLFELFTYTAALSIQRFAVLFTFLSLCIPTTLSATILFEDDFQRANSNSPSSHWLTSERDPSDIAIYRDRLRLRDYQASSKSFAQTFVETKDFTDLSISFEWQVLSSTEASDTLHVGFADQGLKTFETLFSVGLGQAGLFETQITLLQTPFHYLSFWLEVNSQTEGIYLDNIVLSGQEKHTQTPDPTIDINTPAQHTSVAVPEAQSLSLLCLGLFALWASRARHDRSSRSKKIVSG